VEPWKCKEVDQDRGTGIHLAVKRAIMLKFCMGLLSSFLQEGKMESCKYECEPLVTVFVISTPSG